MKKILCFTLSALMILSLLSGCGSKKETITSALYDPTIPVSDAGGLSLPLADGTEKILWSVSSDVSGLNESYVIEKLRGMTGVNLELLVLSPSSAMEKLKVLAGSRQLPDIVGQGFDQQMADDLAMQGAFAAVEDYIDKLPNFKRTFVDNKENSWIFKSYAAPDGKLYGYYGWDWNRDVNTGAVMYRKDIFDKHGIPMWNNTEEFYQALKKLKEIYPESYPYTQKGKDGVFGTWAKYWEMAAHTPYYNEDKAEWFYTDIQPEYKEMLDFMKKLYDEGLMDPEFITNTEAVWTSRMTQESKSFVTTDWIGRMPQFNEQSEVEGYDLRFAKPFSPKGTMQKLSQLCWARYVSNNDKAETAFKLLDFCLSPTGKELITMGIEGETYTLGDDGMAIMKGFEDEPSVSGNKLCEKWGMRIEGMYLSFDRRCSYFNFSEHEKEAQGFAKNPENMSPIDPILQFTVEEKEKINDLTTELVTAAKEFATKYVLGSETGDAAWTSWQEKAKKMGADEIVKIYNDAQKRYDAM